MKTQDFEIILTEALKLLSSNTRLQDLLIKSVEFMIWKTRERDFQATSFSLLGFPPRLLIALCLSELSEKSN